MQQGVVALQGAAALGVSQDDPVATVAELVQRPLEARRDGAEGRLDEQPGAAAERQARELGRVQLGQVDDRDLGPGQDRDRDLLSHEALVDLRHEPGDRRCVVWVLGRHVGGRDERLDAHRRGRPGQLHGPLERIRAVVDPREDVAVEVDHLLEP
jgi:hypothetical protein